MKSSELDLDFDSNSEMEKGKQIIDTKPSATVATTQIKPEDREEQEEGEHLFQSQMWVSGVLLHFIVDNGRKKNLSLAKVVKLLKLLTMPHPKPYKIGCLSQGRDLHLNQQCRLPYTIKPFKDEMLCDIDPLEVSDFLLGQQYMWKHHVVYESRPRSVIIFGEKTLQDTRGIPKGFHIFDLNQVTEGGGKDKFFWFESQKKSFVELKHHLCSTPILSLPDLQQPFEIKTDALDYAVGTILTIHGHPVAYHSEMLSDVVYKYPTYDKEVHSIVQACQ